MVSHYDNDSQTFRHNDPSTRTYTARERLEGMDKIRKNFYKVIERNDSRLTCDVAIFAFPISDKLFSLYCSVFFSFP